jgi:D-alanyl-D-alanine carboxypeptidase
VEPKSYSPIDDIPEAQRDVPFQGKGGGGTRKIRRWLVWFLVGLLSAIAGLVVSWLTYQGAEGATPISLQPMVSVFSASQTPNSLVDASDERKSLLGHLAYTEVPESELTPLANNGSIQLRPAAARQFEAMRSDAARQGIDLVAISGFRTVEDQEYLFFDIKAERAQDAMTRAEVSAPPGYSEHHTGYAIDIGDASSPSSDLQVDFEETQAFQWLDRNAARYSFELSFPEGNEQGVQYEPWHWRYVGDPESLETFYQDR